MESVTPSLAVSTEVALLVRVTPTKALVEEHPTSELLPRSLIASSWRVAVEAPAVGLVELAGSAAG